jgi:hypothetical protein
MTESEGSGSDEGGRVRPSGDAWTEAQRRVRERNDQARKVGKEQRLAAERRAAAIELAAQTGRRVHR